MWRASSTSVWQHIKQSQSYTPISLIETAQKVFFGESFQGHISSFGLLGLIGSLVSHICGTERYSFGRTPTFGSDYSSNMERSLNTWETLWRRHPHAENVPSKYGDPLMVDCLSLLGSAYYHLYMGSELRVLKQISMDPCCQLSLPALRPDFNIFKAVKYAASSWLVRAKLGIAYLQHTAALQFGGHVHVTAYESGRLYSPFAPFVPLNQNAALAISLIIHSTCVSLVAKSQSTRNAATPNQWPIWGESPCTR